jgi:transcriptional regulator with XRE-family HTH domain
MTHEQLAKRIGKRIKEVRIQRNASQLVIANRAKCSMHDLSRYENGHKLPSLPTFLALAKALNVPVDELLRAGRPVKRTKVPTAETTSEAGAAQPPGLRCHVAEAGRCNC